MEQFFSILSQCSLFTGISRQELEGMLDCLGGRVMEVKKNQPIFMEGDPARFVGVVLSGGVQVVREDYHGNRSVLGLAEPGGLFAEVFACAGTQTLPVSVFALQDSHVMLLDCKRVLTVCGSACRFHTQLVSNLLRILAEKNLLLSRKIQFMSQRTTREKVMAFLQDQAKRHESQTFTIPYDRQALADFLGVERSAMSAEIGKLRREGVLDCRGSWFQIHDAPYKSGGD